MKIKAGGWEDEAVRELTEELKLDPDSVNMDSGPTSDSIEVQGDGATNNESEWLIFKNYASAESYAYDYVQEMLEDDPSMFSQDWIQQHIFVTPTDIRIISGEDADAYIGEMSDEEILDHSGERARYDDFQYEIDDLEEQKSVIEDDMEEVEETGDDVNYDALADGLNVVEEEINNLELQRDSLAGDIREKLLEDYANDIADRLENDLINYMNDLGFSLNDGIPNWVSIDYDKAAQDAVNTDGVAHFLDSYDGTEEELSSGAVAFGTN